MSKFLTKVCLILSFSLSAQAQVPTPTKSPIPSMVLNAEGEIEITFPGNRIATLAYQYNQIDLFEMPIKIRTSSCHEPVPQIQCSMATWLRQYDIKMLWKDHPNAEMKGQPVKTISNSEIQVPFTISTWSMNFMRNLNSKSMFFKEHVKLAQQTQITCKDFFWLPQEMLTIDELSFETSTRSEETDLDENKAVIAFRDVMLDRSSNKIVFTGMRPMSISASFDPTPLIAPVSAELIGLTYTDKAKTCSYSLEREVNLGIISEQLQKSRTEYAPVKIQSLTDATKNLNPFADVFPDYPGKAEREAFVHSLTAEEQFLVAAQMISIDTEYVAGQPLKYKISGGNISL